MPFRMSARSVAAIGGSRPQPPWLARSVHRRRPPARSKLARSGDDACPLVARVEVTSRRPSNASGEMSARCSTGRPCDCACHTSAASSRSITNRSPIVSASRCCRASCDKFALVIALAGNLAVERGDQRIFVQPRDQCDRVRHFGERKRPSVRVNLRCHALRLKLDLAVKPSRTTTTSMSVVPLG